MNCRLWAKRSSLPSCGSMKPKPAATCAKAPDGKTRNKHQTIGAMFKRCGSSGFLVGVFLLICCWGWFKPSKKRSLISHISQRDAWLQSALWPSHRFCFNPLITMFETVLEVVTRITVHCSANYLLHWTSIGGSSWHFWDGQCTSTAELIAIYTNMLRAVMESLD